MFYILYLAEPMLVGKILLPKALLAAELDRDKTVRQRISLPFPPLDPEQAAEDEVIRSWGGVLQELFSLMDRDRALIFASKWHMAAFHTMKRKNHLHTHSQANYHLEGLLQPAEDQPLAGDPVEGLDEMIRVITEMEYEDFVEDRMSYAEEERNMGRAKARQAIIQCEAYAYIGDKQSKLYHQRECVLVKDIGIDDLQGCGLHPEKSGFLPCPRCLKDKKPSAGLLPLPAKKPAGKPYTKAQLIEEQIRSICEANGMHAEFRNGLVFVTTVAGEWYFCYNDRPIVLRHRNAMRHYTAQGKLVSEYHIQPQSFYSPLHTLAYIRNHERAEMRRLMPEDEED